MKEHATILSRGVAEVLPDAQSLAKLMGQRKIRVYMGIDPTGSLLTLGHSIGLRKLQQFAEAGHEAILLIGNGTVKIGDPTGKDTTRPMLTDAEIEANFQNWQSQASKILNFDLIKIMHNGDWLDTLSMPQIIKLMANTTVQQLIERDMFQERIKQGKPIHGHEIMYPMLQGFDSVAMDVDLEIGGTDQTFNMMMGRQLQKIYNNREKWVLSTPIINGTDGRKMSKSYNNFVALTDQPTDMYSKLMRISDDLIIEYLTVLTDLPETEINQMQTAMAAGTNPMDFKKTLAHTITTMYHDAAAATKAAERFSQVVQDKDLVVNYHAKVTEDETTLPDAIKKSNLDRSKSDLRRLITQGAVTVNFTDGTTETPSDPFARFPTAKLDTIKVGKRDLVQIEQ